MRPWPWILTALASLVLYPNLVDKESGYVRTLMDPSVFPPALRGIMLAAFAAAYMSTIGTQLNWGASYVVNDFYRRFLRRERREREYVVVSQVVTVALMLVSIYVTLHLASIEQAWKLLIVTGAGTGTVLLLRWFWWRINAWSEVSAMAVAAAVSLYLQIALQVGQRSGRATSRTSDDRHRRADDDRVAGGDVADAAGARRDAARVLSSRAAARPRLGADRRRGRASRAGVADRSARELLNALLGCVLVYAALFGVGELLLRSALSAMGLLLVSASRPSRSRGISHPAAKESADRAAPPAS